MNETLRVTVAGLPASGKTTVALAIADALRAHGMAVDYRDQDGVLPMRVLDQQPQRLAFLGQKGLRVALETRSINGPAQSDGAGLAIEGRIAALNPKPGDVLVLTLAADRFPPDDDATKAISRFVDPAIKIIVVPEGVSLARLDDAQLANAGLQRIPAEEVRPCRGCGKPVPDADAYRTGLVPGRFCGGACVAKLIQDQALAKTKEIVAGLDQDGDPNA